MRAPAGGPCGAGVGLGPAGRLGYNFQAHDKYATESQRPLADRSQEHLGTTDRASRESDGGAAGAGGHPPTMRQPRISAPCRRTVSEAVLAGGSLCTGQAWLAERVGARLRPGSSGGGWRIERKLPGSRRRGK